VMNVSKYIDRFPEEKISSSICLNEDSPLYNPNRLINPEEASMILGVASGTLAVWRCTDRYPLNYVKCGRLVKYRVADILKFIFSQSVFADLKGVN
jgi:hypothetical protein